MVLFNKAGNPRALAWLRAIVLAVVLAAAMLGTGLSLTGCMMSPEDKAFYGRGWINPDELERDQAPPANFRDPTAIPPHGLGPGQY